MYKDECSPEEIKERIREIALNAMVSSAIYEDLDPAGRPYGGFKKKMYGLPTIYFRLRTVICLPICMCLAFCSNIDPCPRGVCA
jgi:hypothetical protein